MMRIITGKAKGIRLKTLEGQLTRPTAERVKEAVFSMLQFDIEGREVLDLFAGSGQMGLEALSRGASCAVLVDRAPEAIRIIQENAEKTKLLSDCSIYRSDAMDYIRRNQGRKFDVIFLDPPYASDLYSKAFRALYECQMLKPSTLIVCESDSDKIFGNQTELSELFEVTKSTRYSKTIISILSPKNKEDEQ